MCSILYQLEVCTHEQPALEGGTHEPTPTKVLNVMCLLGIVWFSTTVQWWWCDAMHHAIAPCVMVLHDTRSTFLPKVVQMCWNSTKWWFFAKIVVGMTSLPIVGVSDITSLSCSPTIWHPRLLEWLACCLLGRRYRQKAISIPTQNREITPTSLNVRLLGNNNKQGSLALCFACISIPTQNREVTPTSPKVRLLGYNNKQGSLALHFACISIPTQNREVNPTSE